MHLFIQIPYPPSHPVNTLFNLTMTVLVTLSYHNTVTRSYRFGRRRHILAACLQRAVRHLTSIFYEFNLTPRCLATPCFRYQDSCVFGTHCKALISVMAPLYLLNLLLTAVSKFTLIINLKQCLIGT